LAQKLQNVSLLSKENSFIDLGRSDIKISADECNRSLFEKIIGDRVTSWIGVKRAMSHIWKLSQPMEIKELGTNYYQFIFESKDDKDKVAKGVNWTYDNQYLILSEWKWGLSINHSIFKELNLWVQVFNSPLDWLSTEVGLKIGKVFKQVKNVVIVGAGSHGGRIMRLLVTVDLQEPLPRCANLRLDDQAVSVGFKYERLMNLCHYCGFIGHLDKACSIRLDDIKSHSLHEGQYGAWMRATDFNRWAGQHSSGSQSPPHTDSPSSPMHSESQNPLAKTSGPGNNKILSIEGSPSQLIRQYSEASTSQPVKTLSQINPQQHPGVSNSSNMAPEDTQPEKQDLSASKEMEMEDILTNAAMEKSIQFSVA
ncbi:Unknown protein, partial [Striga hermonthica]